jgi:hypothetical protein
MYSYSHLRHPTGEGACSNCQDNADSPPASTTAMSCLCVAGFTGPHGGLCTVCVAGQYKVAPGSAACEKCHAGKYSPTVAAATDVCQECSAGKYAAAHAATVCTDCVAGKYAGEAASAGCTKCPNNSHTARSASSSKQACICNSGFTGPNGGLCAPSPPPPSSTPTWPAAIIAATHVVTLSLSLPLSMAEFNDRRQNFIESIARAAGASPADVAIRNIKDISSARRSLLSSSIRVDTSVKAEDQADAVAMSNRLTADSINNELSKVV